ncbi:MAG: terminase small subunit [Shewanella sp.]
MELTPKQENFCMAYLELGNASAAYRSAYNTATMLPESVNRKAKEAMDNPKIARRIQELRVPIMQRHNVTIDSLIAELEEARLAALGAENPQSAAAVSATMGKAKLCGLDKQIIEHRGNIDQPLVIELTPSED